MASQKPNLSLILQGISKKHPDAQGVIAKYYVTHVGFIKNSKTLFQITPDKYAIFILISQN